MSGKQSRETRATLYRLVIAGLFVRQKSLLHLLRNRRIDVMLLQIRDYRVNYALPLPAAQLDHFDDRWRRHAWSLLRLRLWA
jgi:hypothetical protein